MTAEPKFRSEDELDGTNGLKSRLEEAHAHRSEGFLRQAQRIYGEILELEPQNIEALQGLGLVDCELGKYEEGIQLIEAALSLDPDLAFAHFAKGKCLLQQGNLSAAIASFEKAIEIDSDLPEANYHLSLALRNSGNLEVAAVYHQRALAIVPNFTSQSPNMSLRLELDLDIESKNIPKKAIEIASVQQKFTEARAHQLEGFPRQAKQLYEEILEQQPDHFESLCMLGMLAYESGKVKEGIERFQTASDINPAHAEAQCQIGNGFYKLGNLNSAIAHFQKALVLDPDYVRAYYNLGIALHKDGDLVGAITNLKQAIALRGDDAKLHYHLGAVLEHQGKLQEALAYYQKALELKPNFIKASRALVRVVTAVQESAPPTSRIDTTETIETSNSLQEVTEAKIIDRRDREEELDRLQKLVGVEPESAAIYKQIGDIQQQLGNLEAAIVAYQRATEIEPESIEANFHLAAIFLDLNQPQAVINYCQHVIALDPYHAEAHWMYGVALTQVNSLDAAVSHLHQAVAFKPDYANAFSSLGAIYTIQGKVDEAIAYLQRGKAIAPNSVELLYNLAGALKRKGKWDEAVACYKRVIEIKPDYIPAYHKCGEVLAEDNQTEEAIAYFQKSLVYQSDHPIANRMSRLILPVLYNSEEEISYWRYRFAEGLQKYIAFYDLTSEQSRQMALAGISYCTNFYLTYQAKNDLDLQRQYAEFVHRVMVANYPQWVQSIELPPLGVDGKIRIGYISPNLKSHAGVAWSLGWLRHHDRSKFEIYSYFTEKFPDEVTAQFEAESDYFRHIYDSFDAICQQVRDDNLHILVFPDIGMDAQSLKLAVLRLAPIQCACWGHPITSGSPNIEYFLSGNLMEPENAQSHYSETLIRLPKLGFCYPKPQLPRVRKSRKDFQIPEDAIVFLTCQSFYKYLPQYDRILVEIARRVPKAKFVFLCRISPHIHDLFYWRLQKAFAQVELDADRFCIMLPRQTGDDYLSVHLASDIFLDSIGWSGGNTSLEAIACGLPIVTLPGEFMRGRHTYAMLKILEMEATIASNESEYIEIAVRLAEDLDWRNSVVESMRSRHDILYEDTTCVRALEEFYQAIVDPHSLETMLSEGVSHHQAGRLEEARQMYQKILWRQPQDFNALYLLGTVAYHTGRHAEASEYLSKTVALRSDHAEAHKKLGDLALARGATEEALASYQSAIAYKPEYFEAQYSLGNLFYQNGNTTQAIVHYQQAISLNPNLAEAHCNLGAILYADGRVQEAIESLRKAIEIYPNYAAANYNFGTLLFKQGNAEAALPFLQHAIALDPQSSEAHNVLGNVLRELGQLSDAIDSYRTAIALAPGYAEAHRNLGTALLTMGDFCQGLVEYEWRWRMPIQQSSPLPLLQPLWDGSDLNGESILVYSEQGYGDTLQFIRYVPLLKERNARIILACPYPLIRLLSMMEGIEAIADTYDLLPPSDWRVPLMSLPHLFSTVLESIPNRVPYLSAPNTQTQSLESMQHNNIRVGIVWASKPGHLTASKRSCPFNLLPILFSIPGIYFYSLQKDIPSAEKDVFASHQDRITDLSRQIGDFADTAALINKMDLIITVDTAIAHLAGAMGKPVWILLPFAADWRWMLERDDSPWYPTMRLFRQKQIGNWEGVIARVAIDLRKWIN
jgi:tetratricopeptide (TPR) repeat protein